MQRSSPLLVDHRHSSSQCGHTHLSPVTGFCPPVNMSTGRRVEACTAARARLAASSLPSDGQISHIMHCNMVSSMKNATEPLNLLSLPDASFHWRALANFAPSWIQKSVACTLTPGFNVIQSHAQSQGKLEQTSTCVGTKTCVHIGVECLSKHQVFCEDAEHRACGTLSSLCSPRSTFSQKSRHLKKILQLRAQ